jgi:hypothetical protein
MVWGVGSGDRVIARQGEHLQLDLCQGEDPLAAVSGCRLDCEK